LDVLHGMCCWSNTYRCFVTGDQVIEARGLSFSDS
jgi:hypothetical protein